MHDSYKYKIYSNFNTLFNILELNGIIKFDLNDLDDKTPNSIEINNGLKKKLDL
jgi:hypothetical protein